MQQVCSSWLLSRLSSSMLRRTHIAQTMARISGTYMLDAFRHTLVSQKSTLHVPAVAKERFVAHGIPTKPEPYHNRWTERLKPRACWSKVGCHGNRTGCRCFSSSQGRCRPGRGETVMNVFDRKAKRKQRDRAAMAEDVEVYDYLKDEIGYRLVDRVRDVTRKFQVAVDLGCGRGLLANHLTDDEVGTLYQCEMSEKMLEQAPSPDGVKTYKVLCDEEFLPFEEESIDLIVSNMSLHWVNDLPGTLRQVHTALKKDGAFIASMLGGDTLFELRCSLQLAELEREGTYMMQQVMPFYNYVGWEDGTGSHLDQLGRVIAIGLSCDYSNPNCVANATEKYAMWMQDPNIAVPANQRSTVYCTAIAEGGQEEWYHAYTEYINTLVATEKTILLSAMGCSKLPWILQTYLEMSIEANGTIRSQDTVRVISSVAYNPVGYGLAWDFFRSNWDYFYRTYGSSLFAFADLIEAVTAHFNTEFDLQELLDFIDEHPEQGTGTRAFAQAVDQTRANIRWMETYEEEIMAWLDWAVSA
ncbi:uncharacterized protein [Diadema antillarum]|uniref:uncharacterized protein n=1 Tax=Diadema antillarum TaxID=105358 RepID=UPI003A87324E